MTESALAPVSAGVRAAIATYTQAQDAGDTETMVGSYVPDGVLEVSGFPAIVGHDALRAAFTSWAPTKPQLHMVGNTAVTAWTDDTASVLSDVTFMQREETGWSLAIVGRLEDELVRDGDRWRFVRRVSKFSA